MCIHMYVCMYIYIYIYSCLFIVIYVYMCPSLPKWLCGYIYIYIYIPQGYDMYTEIAR